MLDGQPISWSLINTHMHSYTHSHTHTHTHTHTLTHIHTLTHTHTHTHSHTHTHTHTHTHSHTFTHSHTHTHTHSQAMWRLPMGSWMELVTITRHSLRRTPTQRTVPSTQALTVWGEYATPQLRRCPVWVYAIPPYLYPVYMSIVLVNIFMRIERGRYQSQPQKFSTWK